MTSTNLEKNRQKKPQGQRNDVSITISVVYLVSITVMSLNYSEPIDPPSILTKILILSLPVYTTFLAIWKTWFKAEKTTKLKKIKSKRK